MRTPTRAMAANCRWTRTGMVWADWILTGLPYGLRPVKDKNVVRAMHQALIRALPGESLLLGICSGLDPAVVVDRMLDGVDLGQCPQWVAECQATLDTLDQVGPGQRVYWLSVPLGTDRPADRAVEPVRAAAADLRDRLGLPRAGISAGEVTRRAAQAARIAEGIPGPFHATPATPAQMVWLHEHAISRGLFQDLDLPTADEDDLGATLLVTKSGATLGEPVLDEGGQSDVGALARLNPINRRYLKVSDATSVAEVPASYQSLMVIADVPDGGMLFPGSEVIGRIDECGLDVDWAMRLSVRSSASVASKNARALRNLNEQYGQREGEVSHGLDMLDRVAADLAEYAGTLTSDKLEVEAQATTIFAVGGPTPESVRAQARALKDFLGDTGYKLAAPLGYQAELWWAMQPGVPSSRVVREFAQITTSKALAATVPLASVRLGDGKGSLLGLNIAHGPLMAGGVPCGPTSVVLHDLEGASDRQISGSLAVAGELGAGKALALDTPIPTPSGWSSMGDLRVGDLVFDEGGQPTRVLAVSPVMLDHRCFQVVFCDGSRIVADAEHLWSTLPEPGAGQDLSSSGWYRHAVTSTTDAIRASLAVRDHVIPVAGALCLPPADLPVDPYLMGLGATNHIPGSYLRAGAEQRRALLAGLLDAAGTVNPEGVVEFTGTSRQQASEVAELVCSLGYRAELGQTALGQTALGRTALSQALDQTAPGRTGPDQRPDQTGRGEPVDDPGLVWRVSFDSDARVRRVVDVRPVASTPVRCIRVAAESGLFLAGPAMIPTHNTATLMKLAGDVIDRGGQLVIADRTAKGEWATWAEALTQAVVVNTADPVLSLDPLRLFDPATGSRIMQTFLTPLLNVRPTSERGVLLSDVLDPVYLGEHRLGSAGALLAHLQSGCQLEGAGELARLINVFARRDFGRVIFDGDVTPLDLATRAVVIRTHTLQLPSRQELEHEHLFSQLGLEKLFGRAVNALIAAVARHVCFADTSTLAGFVVSEAHSMTISFEGERELVDFVRDGRKHRAVVMLDSHDPEADFGSPTLRGLIPTRIQMRQRDKTLAKRGLAWLDLDPGDESLVELVRTDTSPLAPDGRDVPVHRRGEAIMRDMAGNIGRVKVLLPARAERAAAITAGGTADQRSSKPSAKPSMEQRI